jgi:uncharacterized protein YndB with AHSA1/START domain
MSGSPSADPPAFDATLEIAASPDAVYAALFAPEALAASWAVRASVTTPRPLGIYALEWPRSDESDALLGRLGGAFYGVVIDVRPGRELFLADAYWLPPEGDPIGPMAVHVTCDPIPGGTRLRFQQSGCEESPRWQRLCRVIGVQWTEALDRLKTYLENQR